VLLLERARAGDVRATARLLSIVENDAPDLPEVSRAVTPLIGHAHVVGVTGAPGVGKSTITAALVTAARERGLRVAVLAVDPSSPFSGGALLGDRVRMQQHATDAGVFIRSMASRGHLGGLSASTPQALRVLDACGFDLILLETVGVGQSEVEVVGQADTVLVLLAPGMGDAVQVAKAGVLEIADVFVVNKADRDGASATVRELRSMIALGTRSARGWTSAIVRTVGTTGEGVDDLVGAVTSHREWALASGDLRSRRLRRIEREVRALALDMVRDRLGVPRSLAQSVLAGELDPYEAAREVVSGVPERA
jgi:LAO/AO transport system kinase